MIAPSTRHAIAFSLAFLCSTSGADEAISYKPAANADEAVASIEQLGGAVRYLSGKRDALEVDFQFAGEQLTDEHLQHLQAVENVFVLRLKRTAITDAGLAHLTTITTLRRLHLEGTSVTDAGLKHLAALKDLEFLNLHSTKITDTGLEVIRQMPRLKQLFLWKTGVTAPAIARLQRESPELRVSPDRALQRKKAQKAADVANAIIPRAEKALAAAKREMDELTPK
ncbi:MAG: hypothetical protein VB876_04305 [Pirellulales bacterium]